MNLIELHGTREEIVDYLINQADISTDNTKSEIERYVSEVISVIEQYDTILSDEEWLDKTIPNDSAYDGFVTPDVKYYICIKKITFLLALVIAKNILVPKSTTISATILISFLEKLISAMKLDGDLALYHLIDNEMGEGCILVETSRKKKAGISANHFAQFKGECVNNHLPCRYRQDYLCGLKEDTVKKICDKLSEKKVLRKKGERYYYVDYI